MPDGQTLNTQVIQRAIDAASATPGGGVVHLPPGRYLTGTLVLKDGVTLDLAAGATLLGSTDPADYQLLDPFTDGVGTVRGYALLVAVDARNIGITGGGVIDGQGRELLKVGKERGQDRRPFLVRLVRCKGVTARGVQMRSAAAWNMHLFQCRDATLSELTIHNHTGANNDGIDIDSSENVTVTDCDVDTGDDAICLKTTSPLPCRNITVSGCTLKSNCAAFKMGTESLGDFETIRVSNCHIVSARLGGVKLLSVDGARLRDVVVSDITMDGGRVAVFARLGARFRKFRPDDPKRDVGVVQGVTVRNFRAKIGSPGIMIAGIPGHDVRDIAFENIDLELPGKGTAADAATRPSNRAAAYPEITMFGPAVPAYGVYARHATNVTFNNVRVRTTAPDARPAAVYEDVKELKLAGEGVDLLRAPTTEPPAVTRAPTQE